MRVRVAIRLMLLIAPSSTMGLVVYMVFFPKDETNISLLECSSAYSLHCLLNWDRSDYRYADRFLFRKFGDHYGYMLSCNHHQWGSKKPRFVCSTVSPISRFWHPRAPFAANLDRSAERYSVRVVHKLLKQSDSATISLAAEDKHLLRPCRVLRQRDGLHHLVRRNCPGFKRDEIGLST